MSKAQIELRQIMTTLRYRFFNLLVLVLLLLPFSVAKAQFGQNKVQYHSSEWYFIQTTHFDIYFNQDGPLLAEFAAKSIEDALKSIQERLNYAINNRITLIVYNSQNEFQETNVTDEALSEGIGGFTEMFKNRIVLPFNGNYKLFRHVIHHELVHAVINDMFYGGSIQNVIASNINVTIPLWFNEGLAEYLSLGWDSNTDMFIRDAITSEYLPDLERLDGYFAYRGGQAFFYFIAEKYGEEKVGEIVHQLKSKGHIEDAIKVTLGLKMEELSERWKKFLKRRYWPDINVFQDPDEFAKRLTDHRKEGGFYNTSPAISPQGDKIAFISNRDVYFNVYLMNAQDGKLIKKIVSGYKTADFEELNILTPGLTWSPKGDKIALAAKSGGYAVIYLIDVESEDIETVPLKFSGIGTVHWSPDGKYLTFAGHTASQSDIYTYSLADKQLSNLTNDIYTDSDPSWSADGKIIFFVSDRGAEISTDRLRVRMKDHDYSQSDIYAIRLLDSKIIRLSNTPGIDETCPMVSPDCTELLFISDKNGINNVYKMHLGKSFADTFTPDSIGEVLPVTNSMNGVYQISLSKDGKKMSFSSMYQSGYNIFLMTTPFDDKLSLKELKPSVYIAEKNAPKPVAKAKEDSVAQKKEQEPVSDLDFFTGQYVDTAKAQTGKPDYTNYMFGQTNYYKITKVKDSTIFRPVDNLDSAGNYRVNKYKVNFSPDIIYANAGFSSLYGLMGTTVLSYSDVLGNHRLIGQTSLQVDLKNSDYGLAYYYLSGRLDFGIQGFHTARFVYLNREQPDGYVDQQLYRFRNYGAILSLSYPFNRFYRLDFGLSFINVSGENLDNPDDSFEKASFLLPSFAFVHDNTLFGYTAPIEGTRYRLDFVANPFIRTEKFGFYSVIGDYRTYLRFWYDYSFAIRFSTGMSRGNNAQRFFIGGVENWINRSFATSDVPLSSSSDFAFLTGVLPMRGFNYAEQIGNTYAITNLELRFPLIRYLLTGALPILFHDVIGNVFIDAGSAWNGKNVKFFETNKGQPTLTKDLLLGTGYGARFTFLYFLMKFDVAWAYDLNSFSKPVFYFSLGTDF
ncbi:MAG: biopolymer transporter Tol [Ignavibacteria bacterium]|nr:biopolymer transporter Tol [Ignavibacteria bacterium]